MEEIRKPENFIEKNLRRIKIKGHTVTLAEGQSAYKDIFNTFLLGPVDPASDIGVFNELDGSYEINSEGYLSCAEVMGSFDINKTFLIHCLDARKLEKHIAAIKALADEEYPEMITIKIDQQRGDLESYLVTIKKLFGDKTEVIVENF